MDAPKQLQDKLAQFQSLQNQLQMILVQKQQFMLQNADIDGALGELTDFKEGKVYRMSGPLLLETTKADCEKKLKDERESAGNKVKVLESQEKKLSQKLNDLRGELQGLMGSQMGGN